MKRALLVPAIATILGGCSSLPALPSLPGFGLDGSEPGVVDAANVGDPLPADATTRDLVNRAIHLLSVGRAKDAKQHLDAALAKAPSDKAALALVEQIEADPVEMLGREHSLHTVVVGDTMSALAQRYLGDPLKFYVLSRYNGLASPSDLRVGVSLKIPSGQRPSPVLPGAIPPPAAAPADAAKADTLRLEGLEALNKGHIDRAVALLRKAEALNRGNSAIQRDLERALRIQSSLGQ